LPDPDGPTNAIVSPSRASNETPCSASSVAPLWRNVTSAKRSVVSTPTSIGAAAGGVLTLAVFTLGVAAVGFVARLLPGASLLVALMTYVLQLLVLALVVAAIDGADLGAETLSRGWFAAGVIAVTLTWVVGQLVAATRQRIPVYDTSSSSPATAGTVDHPGGER